MDVGNPCKKSWCTVMCEEILAAHHTENYVNYKNKIPGLKNTVNAEVLTYDKWNIDAVFRFCFGYTSHVEQIYLI